MKSTSNASSIRPIRLKKNEALNNGTKLAGAGILIQFTPVITIFSRVSLSNARTQFYSLLYSEKVKDSFIF
jgi:hypothetical protein